jgi:NADPH:quinone reductase-like Zn-dependent oxidoreductase
MIRGQLRKGETVLIHSGSSAIGQAAITLALYMNSTVFTTVSSEDQRSFLKTKFTEVRSILGYYRLEEC